MGKKRSERNFIEETPKNLGASSDSILAPVSQTGGGSPGTGIEKGLQIQKSQEFAPHERVRGGNAKGAWVSAFRHIGGREKAFASGRPHRLGSARAHGLGIKHQWVVFWQSPMVCMKREHDHFVAGGRLKSKFFVRRRGRGEGRSRLNSFQAMGGVRPRGMD